MIRYMVRHIFLIILLRVINFGPRFRGWVVLLYKNRRSQVLVNGHKTDPFDILRSVLQGDSISPLLFAITQEPFTTSIRRNPLIIGLKPVGPIMREPKKLGAYADDMTPFINESANRAKTTETQITAVYNDFKQYRKWVVW